MNDTVTLSANELRFLLDFCVPTIIVGFEDPWKGFPADLIEFAGRDALGRLIERGLLFFEGNQTRYASNLSDLLDVLTGADECIAIAWVAGDEQGIFSFHRQGDRILELAQLPSGEYTMYWIPTKARIVEILMRPFLGQVVFANETLSFTLPATTLKEAGELARQSGVDAAASKLEGSMVSSPDIYNLATTLSDLKVHYTLAFYGGRSDLSTLHSWFCQILCGTDYIWLIELADEKSQTMRLHCTTLMAIEKRIMENCHLLR